MDTEGNQNLFVLKKSAGIIRSISLSEIDCVTVAGFGMLHLQKTKPIKTGANLVNTV